MRGYFSMILHAHLPYVRHPEYEEFLEEDWLYEAISETYIPLLNMFENLTRDKIPWSITMTMSGTLANMLNDELLRSRYEVSLNKSLELCRLEVERLKDQEELLNVAKFNLSFFKRAKETFLRYNGDLIKAFKKFQDNGNLEIIPVAATHGFLPFMKDFPEAVNAQILMAKEDYKNNYGRDPKGIWLSECAYYPGQDKYLEKNNLKYFIVDAHGIMFSSPKPLYGVYAPVYTANGVAAFARDLESSEQVWSSEIGYPGDGAYREFHKDAGYELDYDYVKPFLHSDGVRRNIGIKYYAITDKNSGEKRVYNPGAAHDRAKEHARDFVNNRSKQIGYLKSLMRTREPIVVSPYDAELYGHWWFEGPVFLEWVFRYMKDSDFKSITPSRYLDKYKVNPIVAVNLSSWGANGYYDVWLDERNEYVYRHLHKAAQKMIELANGRDPETELEERALNQAARELLMAQTSCWEFIMYTETMVGYAKKKISDHINRLYKIYEDFKGKTLEEEWLCEIESRDNIFPTMNYSIYKSERL